MTRPSNQEIERYYFEQFRKHYPSLPRVEPHFTDEPDVIIRGPITIGIEITNLYTTDGANPASEQEQRIKREQVLAQAQNIHKAGGGKPIELSASFHPEKPITTKQIKTLAKAIAAIAKKVQELPSGILSDDYFDHVPELSFMYCYSDELKNPVWRTCQSYNIPLLAVDRLREIVEQKTRKIAQYQICDVYWLLVVIDLMDFAQDQHLTWSNSEPALTSPFERILIYKPQHAQVLEVPNIKTSI